ncbi:MAG: M48 family metallopeptidase [Desulfuromonadaceae bacterium]
MKFKYCINTDLEVEVIRTGRRKSAEIRICDGSVSVRAPEFMSDAQIDAFLHSRRAWIMKKLTLQKHMKPREMHAYVSGEMFTYLGSTYLLHVVDGGFAPVELKGGNLRVTVPGGSGRGNLVRNALIRWYKQRAYEKLNQKVAQWAPQVGANPTKVEIKSFKARWGSCSSTGVVQFNWRIMLAPKRMVEYVVVHELCHLLQHNHSKAYWHEVERVMPDYRICREWFKANGCRLQV